MTPFKMALIPLAVFSLSACGDTRREIRPLPTPPERLVCERAGPRPALPPQYRINRNVRTVPEALAEHDRYVAAEVIRNGIVAGYILQIEGINFTCFNNMAWRREFEAGISAQGD